MPLVIVSGFPCCGKTTYCLQIASYLKTQGIEKIKIINEESENINRKIGYKDAGNEKKTRGALKSAVDHALAVDSFVILDSMNYIKGYRYELFCISRSLRTPHCCVWVECDNILAGNWNTLRKGSNDGGYDEIILSDLRRRFEAPNEKNRWDNPLFRVTMTSDPYSNFKDTLENVIDNGSNDNKIKIDSESFRNHGVKEIITEDSKLLGDDSRVLSEILVAGKPTMTSTKGQVDISCLAVDKNCNIEMKESVLHKTSGQITSSWRPKIKSDASINTSRSFTTLNGSLNLTKRTNDDNKSLDPFSALSFSGSIPTISVDDQIITNEAIMQNIYLHLTNSSQIAAPNSSTISVPRVNADLLHELDRTSQTITQRIVSHQTENVEGTPLMFQDFDRTLALHRHVGLAELQRHRRQFVKTNSSAPPNDFHILGSLFIDFLALNL